MNTSVYPAGPTPLGAFATSVAFETVLHRRLRATPPGQRVIGYRPTADSVTDDDKRRQTPASKTILAH